MMPIRLWILVPVAAALAACAQVPKESVELSVTLGRDLAEVHRAHRELAARYFDRMSQDIEAFIAEKYRPFQIRKTMEDFRLIERIEEARRKGGRPDPLEIMELFVRRLSEQIETYRGELLGNIARQEDEVIGTIDEAYLRLQNANAIVTGHLASIRKVRDAQAELLGKRDLEALRDRMGAKAADLSDRVNDLVERARRGEEKVDRAAEALKELTGEKRP